MPLYSLDASDPRQPFPPTEHALDEPNGLLALGGCLSPQRILNAYRNGIFPWFGPDDPILWWSPQPRMVLFPERLHVARSLRKSVRRMAYDIRYDTQFAEVIRACAAPRDQQQGTWITAEMQQAYCVLHRLGYAHSIEAWQDGELVGGLYGLALGQVFFGESMFYLRRDASKAAFVDLVQHLQIWDYRLIDCQVASDHLTSLGAETIDRQHFNRLLDQHVYFPPAAGAWQL
jgi:leucyl/phenylalanyl-tRNA---protein transferase